MDSVAWIADDAAAACLVTALREAFGPKVHLFPTAAMTGKHLWTLTRSRALFAPMDKALQTIYHRETGQGRVEMTNQAVPSPLPAIYLYDLRFAYAACLEHLPCGEPVHTIGDAYERYTRGRYHIRYTVPPGWAHLGIFMTKRPSGPGWHYPSEPGYSGECWASGTEVALALDCAWTIEVIESITFPNPEKVPYPLDAWRSKLLRIWERAPDLRPYVRDIVLHTIGSFHAGTQKRVTVKVPKGKESTLPRGNPTVRMLPDGSWEYETFAEAGVWQAAYSHPEWTAEIWSRCRVRLLRHSYRTANHREDFGAFTLPRPAILAIRSDALYTTVPMQLPAYLPESPGYFRLKAHVTGPIPNPPDARTLRAIVKEGEGV